MLSHNPGCADGAANGTGARLPSPPPTIGFGITSTKLSGDALTKRLTSCRCDMAWVAPETDGFRSKKGVGCVSVAASQRVLCLGPVHKPARDIKHYFEKLEFSRIPTGTGYEQDEGNASRASSTESAGVPRASSSGVPQRMSSMMEGIESEPVETNEWRTTAASNQPTKEASCIFYLLVALLAIIATSAQVLFAASLLSEGTSSIQVQGAAMLDSLLKHAPVFDSFLKPAHDSFLKHAPVFESFLKPALDSLLQPTSTSPVKPSSPDTVAPFGRSSLPVAPMAKSAPWKSKPCKRGSFVTAEGKCHECAAGTFSAKEGSEFCMNCPLAYTSELGSSECKLDNTVAGAGGAGLAATAGWIGRYMWRRI